MSKALNLIDPFKDDLTKINDRGIKELYKMWRQWDYSQICGCCGERPHYSQEEIDNVVNGRAIIAEELEKRGHVPNSAERKAARRAKAKGRTGSKSFKKR